MRHQGCLGGSSPGHASAIGTKDSHWQGHFLTPGSLFSSGEGAWPKLLSKKAECGTGNGKGETADDKWQMADDKCRMADGGWQKRGDVGWLWEGEGERERSEPAQEECRAPQKAPNEAKRESTQSSLSLTVKSSAPEPAGWERSRSAAGGAVPHDAGNDPFDPIAPAREGKERARGNRRESGQ